MTALVRVGELLQNIFSSQEQFQTQFNGLGISKTKFEMTIIANYLFSL